jgi:hypothetical protein
MSEENSILAAMLSQYETATSFSSENSFDIKNYFSTFLPEGVDNKMVSIRILPVNGTPFQEVHVHSTKVDGKNRKFTCIKHLNDEACPFCEAREILLATGEKTDEELAKTYKPRLMYIVKVIDRENEADGPKFWRFPINYKKDGIMDKVMATVRMVNEDITNPETGRDLVLNIVRVKNPRGGTYPAVNSVQAMDKTPLSSDADLAAKWIANEKTWRDVYSVKDYDYLKIIVNGEVPAWNKKLEKFVAKSSLTEEDNETTTNDIDTAISMGANADSKVETPVETEKVAETYTADVDKPDDKAGDDLPF